MGYEEHPQETMKRLNITYQYATPQSMGDQWWFWNCENVPNPLPEQFSVLDVDPMSLIGFGLNEYEAIEISNYKKTTNENSKRAYKLGK